MFFLTTAGPSLSPAEERLQKRNSKRKTPKIYHVATASGWHGTKHLASSARYTAAFATEIFRCWKQEWQYFLLEDALQQK